MHLVMGQHIKIPILPLVLLQGVLALFLGWPGQLSVDSIIQIYEGRTLTFVSFNPPLMSLMLGVMDRLGSARMGFVLLSVLLLGSATWLALRQVEAKKPWLCLLGVFFVVNPVVLIYTGIVWKDVLFAHAIILAAMLPERLSMGSRPAKVLGITLMAVLLVIIVGVRQQGLLFALPLAVLGGWYVTHALHWRVLVSILLLVVTVGANFAVSHFAENRRVERDTSGHEIGLRVLMKYDMIGMMANNAEPPNLPEHVVAEFVHELPKYSSYRADTLTGSAAGYWTQPMDDIVSAWKGQVGANPMAYIVHRTDVLKRFLGLGDVWQCLPIYRGVAGPVRVEGVEQELTEYLGLQAESASWPLPIMAGLVWRGVKTPLFKHGLYFLAAIALVVVFVARRDWPSVVVLVCSIFYVLGHGLLGIACDFRYGYPLTVVVSLLTARALWVRTTPKVKLPNTA